MKKHDFVVIGSGPGGYIAAIRAAQLGYDTAIIEKENTLGGVCLNWGCIPTKSLLKTAEVYHTIKKAEKFGLEVNNVTFDIKNIVKRSRKVVDQLCSGVAYLMKKNKITVYQGVGALKSKGVVEIVMNDSKEKKEISSLYTILATGAKARSLPKIEFDGNLIWDARGAMMPQVLPKSILIVGSGAIGIEFACFYNSLGVDVTIIELQKTILPLEDKEIAQFAYDTFTKQGMKIYTESSILELKKVNNSVKAKINTVGITKDLEFERIILAVGVTPNTEKIGLENTKIKTDSLGFIETNEWCETGEQGIYAIGDVAGAPCLAHKASHEAVICVEKIAGLQNIHSLNKRNIPSCIYSFPQIAAVGMTEEQALKEGYEIKVGRIYANFNGKAIVLDETEGLIKVIIDKKTGELLGAHMIGSEVTEMINGYVIGKHLEGTDIDFKSAIFPHPTLSEMMHESILCADNESLNS